jgi:hypothetical protein
VNYFLSFKHAVQQGESTVDLPKGAIWKIAPAGENNDAWRAWKSVYTVNADHFQWVPLNVVFPTVEAAQAAIREFITTIQPVFLNEAGVIVTEPYMRSEVITAI